MKQGWEIKRLGEVLVKTETVDPTKKPNDEFIYLDVSSVNKETKEIENASVLIGKDAPSRARKLVRTNDVIFATVRPTHSRVALITEEYDEQVCSTGYFVLRGKEFIFNQYLFYFLLTDEFNEQMEKLQKGASYPAVTDAEVKSILLRFPKSLPEQQRIVAILDEAFAAIAKAKANAEQNLKNAKELFESYLHGVFENKGEGWEEKALDDIIESNIIGLTKNSTEQRSDYEYKYVKMNNITRDNRFDLTKYTCVNATKLEAEKYSLLKGDFLFNTRNSYELVGKTCLFEGYENEVILYNNNIMRIRFIKTVNPHFINYSFTTPDIIKKLDSLKSGTTNVSAIYYKDLKNLKLLIPPLKSQQTIVQKLDALSAETKKLEAIYQQKINDLEELKKSILQKAFAGELRSPEGAEYTNDVATPIAKKKTITSPERA
jgi:type I restriction enzyme S subunit